jgi:hypothetical protein
VDLLALTIDLDDTMFGADLDVELLEKAVGALDRIFQ